MPQKDGGGGDRMKIIKVKYCDECKYHNYTYNIKGNRKYHACVKNQIREIKRYSIIPKWCPLEDYKDEN